ncbi:hypothetical protein [Natronorubrum daqingense]|uniref:hypothetical protein n=1 Tax=Natronorubrum daqingense TaxID=588898 RepID=UPI001F217604|nr:hypothetical protein [Natronorubrum daqingense]
MSNFAASIETVTRVDAGGSLMLLARRRTGPLLKFRDRHHGVLEAACETPSDG